MTHEGEVGL